MAFVEMLKNAFDWDDGAEDEILDNFDREVYETDSILEKIKSKKTAKLNTEVEPQVSKRADRSVRSTKSKKTSKYEQPDLKVVNISKSNANNLGIVANIRLSRFEEVKKITSHLKLNRVVICDFSNLDASEGQRALDFVCGACEAIDADIQRAGTVGSLYIITPVGVNTVGDEGESFRYKGVFPWIKN